MRIAALVVALALCAVPAWPQSGSATLAVVQLSGTNATVTSFGGIARDATASTRLLDRDAIATGLNGSATIASSSGWSVELGSSTRATLRTEPVAGGASPIFAHVLDLAEGSLKASVARGATAWLRTSVGMVTAQDAAKFTISYVNGTISVLTEHGEVTIEAGKRTYVKLKTGEQVDIGFDPVNNVFFCEVNNDAGRPIEFVIGNTVIRANKGDKFQTKVENKHADVRVLEGDVDVTGPDKRTLRVSKGQSEVIVNGGIGAVGGPAGSHKRARTGYDSDVYTYAPWPMPPWDPRDIWYTRQDISPS